MLRQRRRLERIIEIKDTHIATLKANADGWKEVAKRHGADVDGEGDEKERSH